MTRERLARIIRLKERLRDARRGDLAEAQKSEEDAEESLRFSHVELDRQRERYARPQEVTAGELLLRASLVAAAQDETNAAFDRLEEASGVREIRKDELIEAGVAVHSLRLLEEKTEAARARDAAKREQELLDSRAHTGTGR